MAEFLDMGGYGGYVWSAYGLSAVAVLGLAFAIWRRGRRLRAELEKAVHAKASDKGDAA